MTERPELFRAAVLGGPVLDMLRYHRSTREPYWTAEYGSADNPDQFKWLLAYSPYHRLKAGTKYPAVLLTAVEGESEVLAFHARKMAAALQASSGSDPRSSRCCCAWIRCRRIRQRSSISSCATSSISASS